MIFLILDVFMLYSWHQYYTSIIPSTFIIYNYKQSTKTIKENSTAKYIYYFVIDFKVSIYIYILYNT